MMNPEIQYNLGYKVFAMTEQVAFMKRKVEEFEKIIADFVNENGGGSGTSDVTDKVDINNGNIVIGEDVNSVNGNHSPASDKNNIIMEDSHIFIGKNDGGYMNGKYFDRPNTVAIGNKVSANKPYNVAIGYNAAAGTFANNYTGSEEGSICIGKNVQAYDNGIAIGSNIIALSSEIKIGETQNTCQLGNLVLRGDYGDYQSGRAPGLKIISVTDSLKVSTIPCEKIDIGNVLTIQGSSGSKVIFQSGSRFVTMDFSNSNKLTFTDGGTGKKVELNMV
jgi:hypothetical protein